MTLRQVWVRMKSGHPDDPLPRAIFAAQQEAEQLAKSREHDDTMRLVDPNWEG